MFLFLVMLLLTVLFVLQGVAFFTLLERHILGMSQNRFGPKKVSVFGFAQPLVDGVKLLSKEQLSVLNVTPAVFFSATVFSFGILYMEWFILPFYFPMVSLYWTYLVMLVILGLNVYPLIYAGIYSKSKYSYLGGLRSSVASVSYELIFSLNVLLFMVYSKSYVIFSLFNLGLFVLFFSFFISVLVELSRTPFDYSESESELVSGFNIEYSSVGFVLFFLKEYGSLIFFSLVVSVVFFSNSFLVSCLIFGLIVGIRSSFPRVRYDKLMGLFWLQLVFMVSVTFWASFILLV